MRDLVVANGGAWDKGTWVAGKGLGVWEMRDLVFGEDGLHVRLSFFCVS